MQGSLPDDPTMRERDLRPSLDSVRRPPLIVHRGGHRAPTAASVNPVARRSAGAPNGPDLVGEAALRGGLQAELLALEESIAGLHGAPRFERALATVLFTDIVASTERAAAVGDSAWRRLLDRHDDIARSAVCDCGGRLVKVTGDGVLAAFDAPACGLRCARALRVALSHSGIAIRAGLHTGEVELRGDDVAGIAVHIAARIAALAAAGELLVSRTVKELVAGSEYTFTSRGAHRLRGVPDDWELLAVS